MSEYQYYEFQAVDRPLTPQDMAELRKLSTRASITPTRFQNVYHWGDLKGRPLDWMERYFDAFVYVANWGTNWFMLRLPRSLLDLGAAMRYEAEEGLSFHTKGEHVIIEFRADDEEGVLWIEDEEAEGWMPSLLPLRADLAGGDLRSLYIGWLGAAANGLLDEEEIEPPVPPGLGHVSGPLQTLARFLRVSDDLLAVAAEVSPAPLPAPSPDVFDRWLGDLAAAEKDALLRQLAANPNLARGEMLRRFRLAHMPEPQSRSGKRSIGDLLAAAEARGEARAQRAAVRKAAARAKELDALAAREEEVWRRVEGLIEAKQAREYDEAVRLLTDLRDLGVHRGTQDAFAARFAALRERYLKRPALLGRFDKAGLST